MRMNVMVVQLPAGLIYVHDDHHDYDHDHDDDLIMLWAHDEYWVVIQQQYYDIPICHTLAINTFNEIKEYS
jgi:hypothetical protein